MIELERLRWSVDGRDVTCENCHTAMYRPAPDQELCPTCAHAAGQDLLVIHANMQTEAARRRDSPTQT